jgi:hypothetical protein
MGASAMMAVGAVVAMVMAEARLVLRQLAMRRSLETGGRHDHPHGYRYSARGWSAATAIIVTGRPRPLLRALPALQRTALVDGEPGAKVLGITVDDIGVKWGCNHCGLTGGGYFKSNSGRDDGFPGLYDYHHPTNGKLLFQKVRNHPGREPRFWLRRPDGNGGWINNTEGVDTSILYWAQEVNEAIALGHEIAVVEGEKDADNLWKIGIPATCNAHGAADPTKNQKPKWYPEHSEQLRGARIIVFNDNDRAGYDHAEATCKLSLGIAARVRRLDLKLHWPDMPEKADVSDWLALPGNTREKLDALMAMAPDYGKQGPLDLPIVHWHGEVDPRDSRPQLIQDLIPEVGCGLISGQWGTYKTFTALDLAHSVMSREPFLGFEVVRPGGVLFIVLEGQSEIALRVEGVIKDKGKFAGARAPFAWVETCPPLTSADAVAVLTKIAEQVAAKLKAEFDLPLVLIEIDTLIAAAGFTKEGAENDAAAGQAIMHSLMQLARNAHCFVFGVDHFGKDVNVGTRGTSAKEGAADVVLATLGDKAVSGEVTNTRLALRKRRSGANGQEFPFKARVVDMGVNSRGNQETTLVLDWGGTVAPAKTAKDDWGKTKGVKLLRRIIMSMLVDQGVELRPWADGPTVRALKLEDVKTEFFKSYYTKGETEALRTKAKKAAFERAVQAASLDARGVIVTREIEGVELSGWPPPGRRPKPGPAPPVTTRRTTQSMAAPAGKPSPRCPSCSRPRTRRRCARSDIAMSKSVTWPQRRDRTSSRGGASRLMTATRRTRPAPCGNDMRRRGELSTAQDCTLPHTAQCL